MSRRSEPQPPSRTRALARSLLHAALACAAVLFIVAFTALVAWPPVSRVETGATPEYPELQPRAYRFTRPRVHAGVLEVASASVGFRLVRDEPDLGRIELRRAGIFSALDAELVVRVEENGEGGAFVFVSSETASRADFGQNARNVRTLLRGLDENLGVE